jgi:uncharacterized protein YggE
MLPAGGNKMKQFSAKMKPSGSRAAVVAAIFSACAASGVGLADSAAVDDATEKTGLIEISGYGTASAEPELARISVRVTSRCNNTSIEAKNANAVLSNQIIEVLKKYVPEESIGDDTFRIVADPGANVRQTETEGYGESLKIICERKWRASEHISAAIKDFGDLPGLQDELLQTIDAAIASSPTTGASQTWAEMDSPWFDLTETTWLRIKNEAQTNALANARQKVAVFESSCNFTGLRLIRVSDPKFTATRSYDKVAMASATTSTPVRPSMIEVSSQFDFVWSYLEASSPGGTRCLVR